jgi:hypothetical protein
MQRSAPPSNPSTKPLASIFDRAALESALVQKVDKRYLWEDCVLQIGGLNPAPTIGGLGPGAPFGIGARAQHEIHNGRVQSIFVGRGLTAIGGSYFLETRFDMHMPTIGQWNPATATISDQITLTLFARRSDLWRQPFYGGEARSSLANYREVNTETGVSAYIPLARRFDAGGGVSYSSPTILRSTDRNTPSIFDRYTEAQAPGLSSQHPIVDSEAFIRLHTPTYTDQTWYRHDLRLTYDYFNDRGPRIDSFQRFQLFAIGSYELRRNIDTPFHRTPLQNFICEPIAGRQCRFGTLVLDGLVTVSSVRAGGIVPFYMQDTLGGVDRFGFETLRALDDFRFRAPNRVLFQAEFYKGVWGPLGVYAFYDAGRVSARRSDLSSGSLNHDYGPGIFFRAGSNIIVRFYLGLGSGEGVRPKMRFLSAL